MGDKVKKFLKEYVPYVIVIILVIVFKMTIITPIKVNGESMYDTLLDGDIMILNIIDYKIHGVKRFDIVVADEGTEYLIKRVIGLPGETVEYKNNQLYINGKKVKDNYGTDVTGDFSFKVPKDSYLNFLGSLSLAIICFLSLINCLTKSTILSRLEVPTTISAPHSFFTYSAFFCE